MADDSDTILITDENFSELVKKYPKMVVDCWAAWCGPCRMIAPIVEELAKEYKGKIAFGKLNVDENENTSRKFGIMSIPTLLILKDGGLVDKIIGAVPKEHIVEKMTESFPG